MNPLLANIASTVKAALDQGGMGEFTVSARITDGLGDVSLRHGSDVEEKKYNLTLIIQNEKAESDPEAYKKYVAGVLEKFAPLAPYVEFKLPESEPKKEHLKHMGEKFNAVIGKAHDAGLGGSFKEYSDWFRERAELEALREIETNRVNITEGHAIRVSRNDTSVNVTFEVQGGINAEDIKKDLEGRMPNILALIGRMAAKNLSPDKTKPDVAIIEKVKALEPVVTTQKYDSWCEVNIEFRAAEVVEAMKKPGGLKALNQAELDALKQGNPLMQLSDGDGLTPQTPATLKKVMARGILYEGEKGEKPIELFPKIAGPLDEKRGIEKTLKYIKEKSPALAADADALLKDPLFEDHSNWHATKTADGKPKKEMIHIRKREDQNYIEGQFGVELSIPADKLTAVLNDLAALAPQAQQSAPATLTPADLLQALPATPTVQMPAPLGRWTEMNPPVPPLTMPDPQPAEPSWGNRLTKIGNGISGMFGLN